jgi:DNA-binding MarR family transcriptional regulator
MALRLERLGFNDYRRSDALALRWLVHGVLPLSAFTKALGASRQAARKVAAGLVERDFALVNIDVNDSRRKNIELTAGGREYALNVIEVIHTLDDELTAKIDPVQLDSARDVLTFVKDTFGL